MIYASRNLAALLILSLTGLTAGCGSGESGPDLHKVTGLVTFDGTPVESGRIQFRLGDGAGRAYSTEIVNGAYELEMEAGSAKVEITASRLIPGKTIPAGNPGEPPTPASEMYIPAKYNTQTTLTAKIEANGAKAIPFELTSK